MGKQTLTEDQYIEEMNRQLQEHELYRAGMAFLAYPAGATDHGISGYSVTGPMGLMGVYAQIAAKVGEQFDLKV